MIQPLGEKEKQGNMMSTRRAQMRRFHTRWARLVKVAAHKVREARTRVLVRVYTNPNAPSRSTARGSTHACGAAHQSAVVKTTSPGRMSYRYLQVRAAYEQCGSTSRSVQQPDSAKAAAKRILSSSQRFHVRYTIRR